MTEIFTAKTSRRLAFWEAPGNLSVRDIAPETPVTVTVNESGQHIMTAHVDGKTFTRIGHGFTRITDNEALAAVGGVELGTEYGDKVADLAFNLVRLPYPGIKTWADVEPHIVDNYYADAEEIIRAYPHLLSGGERERLAPAIPELAI